MVIRIISFHKLCLPYGEYPNCRQATLACAVSQSVAHTVDHVPLMHTSTLPESLYLLSSSKRMSLFLHGTYKRDM